MNLLLVEQSPLIALAAGRPGRGRCFSCSFSRLCKCAPIPSTLGAEPPRFSSVSRDNNRGYQAARRVLHSWLSSSARSYSEFQPHSMNSLSLLGAKLPYARGVQRSPISPSSQRQSSQLEQFFFGFVFVVFPPAPPSVVWWQEDESEAKTSANGKSAIWHSLCSWHPKDTSHQIILCSWSSWACSFMARTSLPCLEACLKEERHHYAFTTVGTGWGQVDNFDGTKCAPYNTLLCLLGRKQNASWELQQHAAQFVFPCFSLTQARPMQTCYY